MRGVKVLLKYILGILLKGREIVNHSTVIFTQPRDAKYLVQIAFFCLRLGSQWVMVFIHEM